MSKLKVAEIGSKVFAVHNSHLHKQVNGARILIGRVKTYAYVDKQLRPVVTQVGNARHELDHRTYLFFTTLEDGICAISETKWPEKKK